MFEDIEEREIERLTNQRETNLRDTELQEMRFHSLLFLLREISLHIDPVIKISTLYSQVDI